MFTENYIVRVYRHVVEDPQHFVGLVEIVETQEKKAFKNFNELRDILSSRGSNSKHIQPGAENKT